MLYRITDKTLFRTYRGARNVRGETANDTLSRVFADNPFSAAEARKVVTQRDSIASHLAFWVRKGALSVHKQTRIIVPLSGGSPAPIREEITFAPAADERSALAIIHSVFKAHN